MGAWPGGQKAAEGAIGLPKTQTGRGSSNLDVQNLGTAEESCSRIMQHDIVGAFDSSNSAKEMTIIDAGVDLLLLCNIVKYWRKGQGPAPEFQPDRYFCVDRASSPTCVLSQCLKLEINL